MPAPHRRRGLLSSLNFKSSASKIGQPFTQQPTTISDSLPLQISVGSLGPSGLRDYAGGPATVKHEKSSTIISTVHSVPQNSPLKQPTTTKADARQVRDALLSLNKAKKSELLEKMKESNKVIKNLDNLAVITGISGEQLRERVGEVSSIKDIAKAQVSALKSKESKGLGNGYLFSRQLVDNLKSPHSENRNFNQDLRGAGGSRSPCPVNSNSLDQRLELPAQTDLKNNQIRALAAIDRFRNFDLSK